MSQRNRLPQPVEPDLPAVQPPTVSGEEPIDYTDGGAFPGEANMFGEQLYGDAAALAAPEEIVNDVAGRASEPLPSTGIRFDVRRLDSLQTEEDFKSLSDAQKELFILRHVDKLEMTPLSAGQYVLKRNEQKQAQQEPLYQQKLRIMTAQAEKAEREGRGEEYLANGWERYQDPKTGRLSMRIIPGSPADKEIRTQSRFMSGRAKLVLDNLDQAEALVDSFGATGLIGQFTQGIESSPAGVLRSKLDPAIGANVIDNLIEMKKSGASLAPITAPELDLLKRMSGVLSVGLPADVLKPQIAGVKAMWKDVLSKLDEDTLQALDGMGGTPAAAPTGTGEKKKILGQMREKFSDGSWRPVPTK